MKYHKYLLLRRLRNLTLQIRANSIVRASMDPEHFYLRFTHRRSASARLHRSLRPRCNASIKWQANPIAWRRRQSWRRKLVHHFREKKVRASGRGRRRGYNSASLINYVAVVIMQYIRSLRPTEALCEACRISPSLFRAFWGGDL